METKKQIKNQTKNLNKKAKYYFETFWTLILVLLAAIVAAGFIIGFAFGNIVQDDNYSFFMIKPIKHRIEKNNSVQYQSTSAASTITK